MPCNIKGISMAREKKLIVGAINVTMKNHTPERYLELFRDAFKLKTPVNISGDQYGLLANLAKLEKAQKDKKFSQNYIPSPQLSVKQIQNMQQSQKPSM